MLNSPILEKLFLSLTHPSGSPLAHSPLGTIESKKRVYVKNTLEMEVAAERSRDERATKIHTEILEVAMQVSEQCFEVKNGGLVKNEVYRRECKSQWYAISKELVLWKGTWRDRELFDRHSDCIPVTQ